MILEYLNSHVDVIINDELGNALLGSIPVEVVVNGTSILNTTIVDGVLKGTLTSYEPWTTDWPIYGDRIEICGWTSASSNRVCKVIK